MLTKLMYPRPGWFVLHAVAVVLVFLLGYIAEF